MNKKTYSIQGMHCASCEILLEKELKKIDGIKSCHANHKKGTLIIESDSKISFEKIQQAAHKCDLALLGGKKEGTIKRHKNNSTDYLEILLVFIGLLMIGYMLKEIEIGRFFPNVGENIGLLMALIMGVIASVSTCLILVGGIVLSFGSMVASDQSRTFTQKVHPHIYFHVGRLLSFFTLGGLLGLIGGKINYSITFTGYLTILVAAVMLYIGLQILNIVPSITRLGFHLPKGFSKHIHGLQDCEHKGAPMLIGALTFFLPCGFTQSMQLAAVASGSFWTGGMIMLAFAIGTFPALFSLGFGSSLIQNRDFGLLKKIIGVIILLFGLYSFNSGIILSGGSLNLFSGGNASESTQLHKGEPQVVQMKIDWVFSPNKFEIKKGIPVRWEIDGVNVSGCTNEIIIPKLNIRKKINSGMNIVEFTPEKSGRLPFSCWMGMVTGEFIVTD